MDRQLTWVMRRLVITLYFGFFLVGVGGCSTLKATKSHVANAKRTEPALKVKVNPGKRAHKGIARGHEKQPREGKDKGVNSFISELMTTLKEIEKDKKNQGGIAPVATHGSGKGALQGDTIIFPERYEGEKRQNVVQGATWQGELVKADIDFQEAEFAEVAKVFLGDMAKVNYMLSPAIKGKVSIRYSGVQTRRGYFKIFRALCDIYNCSILQDGKVYKVVPNKGLYKSAIPVHVGGVKGLAGKQWITQIIPLKYIDGKKAAAFLRHFVRPGALVVAPEGVQVIIIVDTAECIDRYFRLVQTLDVPFFSGKGIKFYDVKYLDVKTVARELEKVVFALGGGIPGKNAQLSFIPIQEANKLLVVTNTPEIFSQIDVLIRNIDQIGPRGKRRTYFRRLQNVNAVDVAKVLKQLFKDKVSDLKRPDHIDIIADKSTNSLTIRAVPEDYSKMAGIINDLDAQPLQVLVRVIIAEVRLNTENQFGIEWWLKKRVGGGELEVSNFPNLSLVPNNMFSAFFLNRGSIYSLLKLVASDAKVDVLAAPHLVVRNGKTAKINIGQQIPLLKAETTSSEGLQTKETIDYQDTGIKLEITPTISEKGFVTLDIRQESSSAQYSLSNLPKSPVITKRVAETSLFMEDGKTVLLAGIMQKENTRKSQQVPGLSRVPILGHLFKMKSKSASKTELLMAITVNVIREPSEAAVLTEQFERSLKSLRGIISGYNNS